MNNSTEETVTESIEVQTEEPVKNSETDHAEIKKTETDKKSEKKIKKHISIKMLKDQIYLQIVLVYS